MEKRRAHIFVSGRVQGVFFRASAQKRARELELGGWAHNLVDGRVEFVVEGEKEHVTQFIEWCKVGTPLARVENIEVREENCVGEFDNFAIREFGF